MASQGLSGGATNLVRTPWVALFFSRRMIQTECPSCGAQTPVKVTRIPDKGVMTKCESCSHAFIVRPPKKAPPSAAPRKIGGLTIQPRSKVPPPAEAEPRRAEAPATLGGSLRAQKIAERLRLLRDKTYYQILRVAPGGPADQLGRAHQYMMQKEAPPKADPGFDAWKDLVDEAYSALSDRSFVAKYERLVRDSEMSPKARIKRKKLEVDPKVHRMTVALARNALGEATYLNEWALSLDPDRKDLAADRAFIEWRTAPAAQRSEKAERAKRVIAPLANRWFSDDRLKLYLVMLTSTTETIKKAKRIMKRVSDEGHPLYEPAKKTLSYKTKI